jgi:hypothetical protein
VRGWLAVERTSGRCARRWVEQHAKEQAEQSGSKRRAVQTQKMWAGTGSVWVRRQNKAVAGGGAAGAGSSAGVSNATQEQLGRRWSTEAAPEDGVGLGRRRAGFGLRGDRGG